MPNRGLLFSSLLLPSESIGCDVCRDFWSGGILMISRGPTDSTCSTITDARDRTVDNKINDVSTCTGLRFLSLVLPSESIGCDPCRDSWSGGKLMIWSSLPPGGSDGPFLPLQAAPDVACSGGLSLPFSSLVFGFSSLPLSSSVCGCRLSLATTHLATRFACTGGGGWMTLRTSRLSGLMFLLAA